VQAPASRVLCCSGPPAVKVGATIHVGTPKTHDVRSDLRHNAASLAISSAESRGKTDHESGRDGGSRTRNASGYEPEPGTTRIAAMARR
jgi:hypothetical protein